MRKKEERKTTTYRKVIKNASAFSSSITVSNVFKKSNAIFLSEDKYWFVSFLLKCLKEKKVILFQIHD
jgi:hypothetical protein